jgi:ABC-type phosphate/phosphonate transport system substrate-binding protein
MKRAFIAAAAAAALLVAGCGSSADGSSATGSSGGAGGSGSSGGQVTLKLGFLANITHATALVGVKQGFFTKNLGNGVTLKLTPFSTGTEEATALLAGQLDAAYVGPNPAIKACADPGRQAHQGHLRGRVRRGRAGRQEGHHERGSSSRASRWRPRRSATPRTWRCATG